MYATSDRGQAQRGPEHRCCDWRDRLTGRLFAGQRLRVVTWCVSHLAGLADAAAYDPSYAKWR